MGEGGGGQNCSKLRDVIYGWPLEPSLTLVYRHKLPRWGRKWKAREIWRPSSKTIRIERNDNLNILQYAASLDEKAEFREARDFQNLGV